RLPAGQRLDEDLPLAEERGLSADKGQHAAIRRKRGLNDRIREVRELDPLGAAGRMCWIAQPQSDRDGDDRERGSRNRCNFPAIGSAPNFLDRAPRDGDVTEPASGVLLETMPQ